MCTSMPTALRYPMQVMVTKEVADEVGGFKEITPTSTCVLIEGVLAETPPGTKQKVELKATKVGPEQKVGI